MSLPDGGPPMQRRLHDALGAEAGEEAWRIVQSELPVILGRMRDDDGERARLRQAEHIAMELADARQTELAEARKLVWLERDDVEELTDLAWSHMSVDTLTATDHELRARVLRALEDHQPPEGE